MVNTWILIAKYLTMKWPDKLCAYQAFSFIFKISIFGFFQRNHVLVLLRKSDADDLLVLY